MNHNFAQVRKVKKIARAFLFHGKQEFTRKNKLKTQQLLTVFVTCTATLEKYKFYNTNYTKTKTECLLSLKLQMIHP